MDKEIKSQSESNESLPRANDSICVVTNGSDVEEELSLTVKQEVTGNESLELQLQSEALRCSEEKLCIAAQNEEVSRVESLELNVKSQALVHECDIKREDYGISELLIEEVDIKTENIDDHQDQTCIKPIDAKFTQKSNLKQHPLTVAVRDCIQLPKTAQDKLEINSVQYILKNYPVPYEKKLLIKRKGRPTPDLVINCSSSNKTRTYQRVFNKNVYEKYWWLCGCIVTNKLFCFVCLLFKKDVSAWSRDGMNDLKHIAERTKRHESSVDHFNACLDFSVLGKIDIRDQLDNAYVRNKIKHNEQVEKNRHILRRLIMCIKFCGAFELALRGHDERELSDNPGIYKGLINFAGELDSALATQLNDAKVFKGTSKSIQNELLDVMFAVYRTELIKQIKSASFIALQAAETTDASNHQQMVVIIRYVSSEQIQICERFWSFIRPAGYTAEELSRSLLAELQHMLDPSETFKLIAQSYDGASVMSSKNNGVQAVIRNTHPCAYFVHCYAHQFNLIMEQAAQCHRKVKIFFAHLQAFSSFFSQSPKRTAVLNEAVKRRLAPRAVPTRWNFKSRTVNTLFEYKDLFIECFEEIVNGDRVDPKTISEACGFLNHLKCPEFLYWLKLFHFIMPHVEVFFNQAERRGIESVQLQNAVEHFQQQIMRIKSYIDNIEPGDEEPAKKRQKTAAGESRTVVAKEVCDNILTQIKDRFDFKNHLSAAKLFDSANFKSYGKKFPQECFDATVESYSMLESAKLKRELTVIYERDDMSRLNGILSLLVFISDNNLKTVLTETYKLVNIICTTPMSTSECERCFTTLKRIKTFLRSTMTEDRLNALAVLSIEKTFIQCIPDFDNKVIDTFCAAKDRKMDFIYK